MVLARPQESHSCVQGTLGQSSVSPVLGAPWLGQQLAWENGDVEV